MSIKAMIKVCSVAALLLLVFAALGPGKWIPRSGYGWRIDHFVCYFAFTLTVCLAWPRALVVGGAMTAFAVLLEGLQAFTPDRIPDVHAALYSAGGVMAASLPADLFMRASRRLNGTFLQVILGLASSFRPASQTPAQAADDLIQFRWEVSSSPRHGSPGSMVSGRPRHA